MKIFVDAHLFDGSYHGSRTYLKGIYTEMIDLKKEWHFYFAGNNISKLKKEFGNGENVHYVKLKSRNKIFRLLFEMPYLIYKLKVNYAHFQYITPLVKTSKYIVTTHDILFEEERFQSYFPKKYKLVNGMLFKRSAKRADILLTVSEYSKEKISKIYNIAPNKIHITPNAISEDIQGAQKSDYIEQQYGIKKYILFVSRIEPRKNHLSVLKAYINLKLYQKGYQVVFIGFQDIRQDSLYDYIESNKEHFENRLHFISNIPHDELKHFYVNAELMVYPSLAEGFGIPPLEAAMNDQTVVCSSATAMQEFTFFKYHVNPYNQNEIEEAIQNTINNPETDHQTVKKAIAQRYHWKKSAQILIDQIHE
jgi:glycosyltransferase involved in cell wall biosynthesis